MSHRLPMPALTSAQMAEVDRLMVEEFGIELIQMMEQAGQRLAEQARRMLGGDLAGLRILVTSGGGNNGGGGLVAARNLHNHGAQVAVGISTAPQAFGSVPGQHWRTLNQMGLGLADFGPAQADLIIDALVGYGLRGQPTPALAARIDRLNSSGRPILALDVPSGLNATTGAAAEACIRSATTLTLALPKMGLLVEAARPYVGELVLADIGVPPALYRALGLEVGPIFSKADIIPAGWNTDGKASLRRRRPRPSRLS